MIQYLGEGVYHLPWCTGQRVSCLCNYSDDLFFLFFPVISRNCWMYLIWNACIKFCPSCLMNTTRKGLIVHSKSLQRRRNVSTLEQTLVTAQFASPVNDKKFISINSCKILSHYLRPMNRFALLTKIYFIESSMVHE